MHDMWKIAAYVEDHPDDYPQRWRLAKKFYAAHEYRHAQEHLNALKNEWIPKLNVRRYLAATYYRLGRYGEAIRELEETIDEWPDELGVREQLAHVHNAQGSKEAALNVWQKILKRHPEHAIAAKAVKRLEVGLAFNQDTDGGEARDEFASDSAGVPSSDESQLMPGTICFNCGARNSDEFDACWHCGQPFQHPEGEFFNTPSIEAHGPLLLRPETIAAGTLLIFVALLAIALWLGTSLVWRYQAAAEQPLDSLSTLYDQALAPSRIATGVLLLVLWPVVLKLTLKVLRARPMPPAMLVYSVGLFLGGVALVFLLLPPSLLVPGIAIILFLALAIVVVGFELSISMSLVTWLLHVAVICVIGVSVFWLTECRMFGALINPFAEVASVHSYVRGSHGNQEGGSVRLPDALTPIRQRVRWQATGSDWIDARAARIMLIARTEEEGPQLQFQIYEGQDLRFHEELVPGEINTMYYNIVPGVVYEIVVAGAENTFAQILVHGLLRFEVIE